MNAMNTALHQAQQLAQHRSSAAASQPAQPAHVRASQCLDWRYCSRTEVISDLSFPSVQTVKLARMNAVGDLPASAESNAAALAALGQAVGVSTQDIRQLQQASLAANGIATLDSAAIAADYGDDEDYAMLPPGGPSHSSDAASSSSPSSSTASPASAAAESPSSATYRGTSRLVSAHGGSNRIPLRFHVLLTVHMPIDPITKQVSVAVVLNGHWSVYCWVWILIADKMGKAVVITGRKLDL
jgi:hypothetical protein